MPFDQSTITEVRTRFVANELRIFWTSTSPAGTPFQVYIDGLLMWHGVGRQAIVPRPIGIVRVDVGAVAPGEETLDFSGSLAGFAKRRARLSWLGGTYLDGSGNDDVAGFRVYGEATPGGGIDYAKPLASIPAYRDGVILDGYGLGGYGQGGYGRAASTYEWHSEPLYNGTWAFAVKSFDHAGNEGAAMLTSVQINVPPRPPAMYPDGTRILYSWNQLTHNLTLTWQASPG